MVDYDLPEPVKTITIQMDIKSDSVGLIMGISQKKCMQH